LAEKEAEKAAKLAEREAAKAARKAEKDAEREAAKAAKQAEKEAAPVVAKEQRLPIPWCGKRIEGRCEALRVYHGLFAQCTADATEISAFCPSCEKSGAKFGTCAMRAACGLFDYVAPNGKKCVRLANVIDKFGFAQAGEQAFQEEAAKHNITIPYEHLEKEVKQRGRPKSSSPRARPAAAAKIATSDTGSGSETETDDEEYQAKKQQQQQQRKKVTKTAAAAATESDAAPKKRGRPAKAKEAAPQPKDDLIQDLVASAKKAATPKAVTPSAAAKSAPASPELSEDEVSSPLVVTKPAAKLSMRPKAAAKPKAPERVLVECDGEKFWVEKYNGEEILVRCSDNLVFCSRDGVGYNIGTWDEKMKTVIEDDEESSDDE
jgi:histone H1/5